MVLTVTSLTPLANLMPHEVDNSITAYAASERLYNQWEDKWRSPVSSDGANLYDSGCGIFATANAIYSLNGIKMDPKQMAIYTYGKGVWGVLGTLSTKPFFDTIESKYGSSYYFQIDYRGDGHITDLQLINHLNNGGVAVAHVNNHYIAIDDYRSSDHNYHVIESAVNTKTRNLKASGWVSASKLQNSSTKTYVD